MLTSDELTEIARELARITGVAPPAVVAEGSHQGNVQRDVKPENVRPGLVPCPECGTGQRPGAVHFASNTEIRPCVGSWRRR